MSKIKKVNVVTDALIEAVENVHKSTIIMNEGSAAKRWLRGEVGDSVKVNNKNVTTEELVQEKHLTSNEIEARGEIADAMKKKFPEMPKPKLFAIATATAKRVAEEVIIPDNLIIESLSDDKVNQIVEAYVRFKTVIEDLRQLGAKSPATLATWIGRTYITNEEE